MTEREKMLAGKLYDISDPELATQYVKTRRLVKAYNLSDITETEKRTAILKELIPSLGKDCTINEPIQFDYGVNTKTGDRCFINYNLTVLDCAPVILGDDVFIGPNCTLATPVHPLLSSERKSKLKADGTKYDLEYAKPIHIQNGVWLPYAVA
jgi:maltose O-acetyltransferase